MDRVNCKFHPCGFASVTVTGGGCSFNMQGHPSLFFFCLVHIRLSCHSFSFKSQGLVVHLWTEPLRMYAYIVPLEDIPRNQIDFIQIQI